MHIGTILSLAIHSLLRSPLRSALTTLGVVIGVGALLTMTCIGNGAKLRIQEALARPEAQLITLGAVPRDSGSGNIRATTLGDGIKIEDYLAL
jgi:ABC-type antimicrobial peptide transport system permease subunit